MTALFADIEGFTSMAERLPPREVVALLNEYFTAMTEVVNARGGRIDKYIGDAMMVVWEGEPAHGAEQAVCSALEMREALEALQQKWLDAGKLPIKIRIGISSGAAIVGMIGSPWRRDRTVIGDAVNMASRLEALNKDFHTDVIMSRSTYIHVQERARARSLGIVSIKGRREAVEVYALLGWDAG